MNDSDATPPPVGEETTAPHGLRTGLIMAITAAALVVGIAVGLLLRDAPPSAPATAGAPPGADSILRGPFRLGGDFALTDQHGESRRLADFAGNAVLMFFGYTYCPDICPSTLADLRLALRALGSDAEQVQVLFVSVDSERDTPARLAEYVGHFDPGYVGLTGSPAEIAAVTRAWGVAYEIGEKRADGGYDVGHSGFTYLLGTDGALAAMIPYGTPWQAIADETRSVL